MADINIHGVPNAPGGYSLTGKEIMVHDPTAPLATSTVMYPASGLGGGVAFAATKAAANALTLTAGTWVRVAADEENNGDKSMYLYTDGATLEFQYTIT